MDKLTAVEVKALTQALAARQVVMACNCTYERRVAPSR